MGKLAISEMCYNLKLELRLYLGKDLREVKGLYKSSKV